MRMITCVTLVSAYLLFHVQLAAAADGIGGWPLLHWGMSRQQVERAYPKFEKWLRDIALPPELRDLLGVQAYSVGGCEFSVELGFDDNRLSRVHLEAFNKKGGREEQACLGVKYILTGKYGLPDKNSLNWLIWTVDGTLVVYIPPEFTNDSDHFFIIVNYLDEQRFGELYRKVR